MWYVLGVVLEVVHVRFCVGLAWRIGSLCSSGIPRPCSIRGGLRVCWWVMSFVGELDPLFVFGGGVVLCVVYRFSVRMGFRGRVQFVVVLGV